MKNNKVVYLHKNKETQQVVYVGAGNSSRPYNMIRRSKEHLELINSVGVVVEVVQENLTPENASKLEIQLIKQYGLENLLNKRISGAGTNQITEEGKRRLAEFRTGRKHSEETRAKISSGNKGKIVSQETRQRMSDARVKRQVRDMYTENTYNSVKEAAADLGLKYSTAMAQLRGRTKRVRLQYV